MLRSILIALSVAVIVPVYAQAPAASPADTPLIERAKLFGNPTKTAGRVSPDGKWLSWIAPRDGVLNVWVAPLADPSAARALTDEKTRPIRSAFWSPDSKTLLFINDKGGDENFLLYGVDVVSGKQTLYTPFEKTRVQLVNISRQVKDRILIAVNNRDPRWHDVYSLHLPTGKLTLVYKNDGYAEFFSDESLNLRLAAKARKDGGNDFYRISNGKVENSPIGQVGLEDSLTTAPLGFTTDGKTLYWRDSRGRDTAALIAQDVASGKPTVIATDVRADITSGLFDVRTGRIQAYELEVLKREYVPIDPSIKADLDFLEKELKGQFSVTSRSDKDDKWTVAVDTVSAPAATYLYDRKGKRLTKLYVSRPELEGAPLVPMFPQEIQARDGLTLVSYLSLPKSADPQGSGKAERPVPMVLFVHGGPWGRDSYGYHSYHQWLANRGYAVLSVNFRASTGFGKEFIAKGNLEWGRKMHDDLLDAVDWAVANGITTRDKVAIMGGSYGGYATLAGLTFTPEAFACGVDIVGPSNLFTLLETIPPYWEAFKQQFYRRMGDPTTESGRAMLKERSPLNFADKIVRPLLIGQGANDPRVNVRESDQIVAAMNAKSIPVTYVVFPDEGHGFARPVNNIAFNAVAENFLGNCLGGRAEPIGAALKGSTAQVKQGAQFVQGLQEAVGGK
ncbi:S9 family peptidase [Massilia horti]|uniref:S9 family peptidase n=1 Tax=Massilia horti TaxID=2562153 RepID=A0A4Y9ST70_9BURK|nr:S9 family peptidase [Massilia horti]TFW27853.1 S9 family peptidase [Massilia horti]